MASVCSNAVVYGLSVSHWHFAPDGIVDRFQVSGPSVSGAARSDLERKSEMRITNIEQGIMNIEVRNFIILQSSISGPEQTI